MNPIEGAFTSKQYLRRGLLSDVKIDVIGGIQKRQFQCHKIILASKSQVLEKLVENEDKVEIRNTDPDIFYKLVCYIYTDRIKTVHIDHLPDLFRCAQNLGLTTFENMYKREIRLDLKYVLYNLEYSRKTHDTKTEKVCQSFIEKFTKVVLKKNLIESVSPETILWLLNHNHLNLDSDYELMEFLGRYRDRTNPTDEFMQKAKRMIRYLNIDKQRLIQLNSLVKILNEQEMLVIIMNMNRPGTNWIMMEGYTRNTNKRSKLCV